MCRMHLVLAAKEGFSFADPYAIGLAFAGVAVFVAIAALSHQHERAFSASVIYLALGLGVALVVGLTDARWLEPAADASLLEHMSEIAIVVALFSAGLKIERSLRRAE